MLEMNSWKNVEKENNSEELQKHQKNDAPDWIVKSLIANNVKHLKQMSNVLLECSSNVEQHLSNETDEQRSARIPS